MLLNKLLLFTIALTFLVLSDFVYGQDRVSFRINLKGIDNEKLIMHFDDGIVLDVIALNPGDSTIIIEKPIYTSRPSLSVNYKGKYYKNFFIDNNPGVLNLSFDANKKDSPFYSDKNTNITAIYDSTTNKIYRDLFRGQSAEIRKLNDLLTKHGQEIRTNDSVKYELAILAKAINAKSMHFLTSHSEDFFSFYYFKDQVLGLTNFIGRDSEYYTELLDYYNNTFPPAFRHTAEGNKIKAELKQKISPVLLEENKIIPDIYFKDLAGDTIFFKNQGESFVLLDFWASWCLPCIQQIPDIRALHGKFSTDRLKIISISIDRDSIAHANSIKEHQMYWNQSLDRGGLLSNSLGISSIPTVVLLDQNGRIVYYKNGGKLDLDKIKNIIKAN